MVTNENSIEINKSWSVFTCETFHIKAEQANNQNVHHKDMTVSQMIEAYLDAYKGCAM